MNSSQPKIEITPNKNIATKIKMPTSTSRLRHPLTRTCQGVWSVVWRTTCGFPIALTLPQCHRICLRTRPTTPARKKPIIHPKSPGPSLSPIQAPFSEIKRGLVPRNRPRTVTVQVESLDKFPYWCYNRTNVLLDRERD